ncbi:hypothetical protein BSZ22_20675 [Bradyrhizobium canariense]|nr:hypothetical protein BSZ22_20675 [Bradyrhizobium canariense]OSI78033.1 hypothetical protein BSZ23_19675 [Bradyrhizobium canariense]OSI89263.1 hypothetical protein BSZ25_21145 [Bradyrhizobium canariense]OSI93745.1 hypothetical protein BSZ24_12375 [Bradyrhizobium canariense]OSJ03062.1 hypothetical protein BSZ16_16570 [Bradyrhizobium canariense]
MKQLEQLEGELICKGARSVGAGTNLSYADFFIFGALRRTLAQSRGFRDLINSRNFPCAAAILRLQIDTAMRVNVLGLIDDVDQACRAVLDGEQFNRLKDRDGTKLSDAHLRRKLAEKHPWISKVYEQTSNFVHLSGKHFEVSIARTDDESRIAYFQISGHDPHRPEETYFEAVDAFFEATKLAGMLLLAFWMARHQHEAVLASMSKDSGARKPPIKS